MFPSHACSPSKMCPESTCNRHSINNQVPTSYFISAQAKPLDRHVLNQPQTSSWWIVMNVSRPRATFALMCQLLTSHFMKEGTRLKHYSNLSISLTNLYQNVSAEKVLAEARGCSGFSRCFPPSMSWSCHLYAAATTVSIGTPPGKYKSFQALIRANERIHCSNTGSWQAVLLSTQKLRQTSQMTQHASFLTACNSVIFYDILATYEYKNWRRIRDFE